MAEEMGMLARKDRRVGSQARGSNAEDIRRKSSRPEDSDLEREPVRGQSLKEEGNKDEATLDNENDLLMGDGPLADLLEEQIELDQAQEFCLEAHCLLNGHGIG